MSKCLNKTMSRYVKIYILHLRWQEYLVIFFFPSTLHCFYWRATTMIASCLCIRWSSSLRCTTRCGRAKNRYGKIAGQIFFRDFKPLMIYRTLFSSSDQSSANPNRYEIGSWRRETNNESGSYFYWFIHVTILLYLLWSTEGTTILERVLPSCVCKHNSLRSVPCNSSVSWQTRDFSRMIGTLYNIYFPPLQIEENTDILCFLAQTLKLEFHKWAPAQIVWNSVGSDRLLDAHFIVARKRLAGKS